MPAGEREYPGFKTTLDSVRIILRWQVLLTAFAVCAVFCEAATMFLLKLAAHAGEGFDWQTALAGGTVSLLALCWGGYLVSHEADALLFPTENDRRFGRVLAEKPLHFLLPPVLFACAFAAVFFLQVGIAALMEAASLPAAVFPLLFVAQFAAGAGQALLAAFLLLFAFLWVPHVSLRGGLPTDSFRSFSRLLSDRTFRALSITFLWLVISLLLFWYVFFPAWKVVAAGTLKASRMAMGERFDEEVVGEDNLLSCVVEAIESDALTPGTTVKRFAASLGALRRKLGREIDPFNARGMSTAGLLFLVAIVFTLAAPAALSLAVFAAAGAYAYRVMIARPGETGTVPAVSDPVLGSGTGGASVPADDEDTFIEEIAPEPMDLEGGRSAARTGEAQALEKFVDFDYGFKEKDEKRTAPPVADKPFQPKPRKGEGAGEAKPYEEGRNGRKLREPKPQHAPGEGGGEKGGDEEGDYTIFDLLGKDSD
ncbi:MAG: hypothetical protein DRP90_01095 [Planctomycetota bacterium]|nr:MAG: hypothetical protein DRP90_01095 [Planctomycetota bacterium]